MTKKLEELFNLGPAESPNDPPEQLVDQVETIREIDETIDKIDAALPTVKDLDTADTEMDHLAQMAEERFTDLMDLGMQVEPRYAGVIFQTAGTLLGHAITAKQAKLDKKLRMVDLQLKKMRLDQSKPVGEEGAIEGQGVVLDRNDLLKQILSASKK